MHADVDCAADCDVLFAGFKGKKFRSPVTKRVPVCI
jgi:hypothetical protein